MGKGKGRGRGRGAIEGGARCSPWCCSRHRRTVSVWWGRGRGGGICGGRGDGGRRGVASSNRYTGTHNVMHAVTIASRVASLLLYHASASYGGCPAQPCSLASPALLHACSPACVPCAPRRPPDASTLSLRFMRAPPMCVTPRPQVTPSAVTWSTMSPPRSWSSATACASLPPIAQLSSYGSCYGGYGAPPP